MASAKEVLSTLKGGGKSKGAKGLPKRARRRGLSAARHGAGPKGVLRKRGKSRTKKGMGVMGVVINSDFARYPAMRLKVPQHECVKVAKELLDHLKSIKMVDPYHAIQNYGLCRRAE